MSNITELQEIINKIDVLAEPLRKEKRPGCYHEKVMWAGKQDDGRGGYVKLYTCVFCMATLGVKRLTRSRKMEIKNEKRNRIQTIAHDPHNRVAVTNHQ